MTYELEESPSSIWDQKERTSPCAKPGGGKRKEREKLYLRSARSERRRAGPAEQSALQFSADS